MNHILVFKNNGIKLGTKYKGNISTVSGVLNSCTYVGSAISTYGIALLSESAGWQTTSFVWFLIAALGAVVCTVCSRIWK